MLSDEQFCNAVDHVLSNPNLKPDRTVDEVERFVAIVADYVALSIETAARAGDAYPFKNSTEFEATVATIDLVEMGLVVVEVNEEEGVAHVRPAHHVVRTH
jgi:hypothetical protein